MRGPALIIALFLLASPPPTSAQPASTISGTVLERIDSGGYSYLRLKTSGGETWAAVPLTTQVQGASVTLVNPMRMEKFTSKTLNRTWDVIHFAQLAPPPAPAAAKDKKPTAKQQKAQLSKVMGEHQKMTSGPTEVGDVKVPRAEGPDGRTVAEVWAQRAALKDKTVAIRGKVVKMVPEVMGKTWLHLRDGTGSAASNDHDLTVTTKGAVAVGDVVTISGVLRVDRNFGAGYAYPVIVEDASVAK